MWLSAKWPHLAATGEIWLCCSIARASIASALGLDDAALVARVTDELREAMALSGMPLSAHVTRCHTTSPDTSTGSLASSNSWIACPA